MHVKVALKIIRHYSVRFEEPALKAGHLRKQFRLFAKKGVEVGPMMLMAMVGFVLLIACTNIAGLLLARGVVRAHEMAVRSAVGANRIRLIRQLLVESLLIGIAGGAAGLMLSV